MKISFLRAARVVGGGRGDVLFDAVTAVKRWGTHKVKGLSSIKRKRVCDPTFQCHKKKKKAKQTAEPFGAPQISRDTRYSRGPWVRMSACVR